MYVFRCEVERFFLILQQSAISFRWALHFWLLKTGSKTPLFWQSGWSLYFSGISNGTLSNGTLHMIPVLCRSFRIHRFPSLSATICSSFSSDTSMNANPVQHCIKNPSRISSNRGISNSFVRSVSNSSLVRNSLCTFFSWKRILSNGFFAIQS